MEFIDFDGPSGAGKWTPSLYYKGYRYYIKCNFKLSKWTNNNGYSIDDEKHKWLIKNLKREKGQEKRYDFLKIPVYNLNNRPDTKIGVLFRTLEDAMAFKLAFDE